MGHLLKLNHAHSPLNLRIFSSSCVPFTLTTVQVPNLALTHKKRLTVCISVQNGRQRKGEGWDASWKRKYKDWPREKLSFFYFLSCGNCVPHLLETLHTGKLLPGPPFSSRTSVSALGYVTFGRQKSRQLLPEFLMNTYKLILNRWFHTIQADQAKSPLHKMIFHVQVLASPPPPPYRPIQWASHHI
jgi:hypothetical protein